MIHKRLKYFLWYYSIYCILLIGTGIYLGNIVNKELFEAAPPTSGQEFMSVVLTHNLTNFAMYLLGFLLSPLFQIMDFGGSSFVITMGFRTLGAQEALGKLIPHGLLEFPNMLFYQGISQYVLFTLIYTKSIKAALGVMKKMIPYYLLSLVILIIAAFIEGYDSLLFSMIINHSWFY
ncbi:stage II sporulation protein M [Bacillus sp. FSL M7-0558]|uniref:stage II sporulation protein M n=1 Tax=Bacillus sp. FSL M7-0558 TaxID=2921533 RepID=UPI0030F8FA02